MNIAYIGDTHLRATSPESRVETNAEFCTIQLQKLNAAFTFCEDRKIEYLLQGGDFLELLYGSFPYWLIGEVVAVFQRHPSVTLIACLGQHETKTLTKTALRKLPHNIIRGWTGNQFCFLQEHLPKDLQKYNLQLAHWGQEPEQPQTQSILLTHRSVYNTPPTAWEGFETIPEFMTEGPGQWYKLILCGDIHIDPGVHNYNGNIFLNAGSFCRTKIGENHWPRIYTIDLNSFEIKYVEVQYDFVKPYEKAFNLEANENKKKFESDFKEFISELKITGETTGLALDQKVQKMLTTTKLENPVRKIVDEAIEAVGGFNE